MQQLLPVKVEELVAQRVTEAAASSVPTGDVAALEQKLAAAEAARDAAQKEADGAVDDLADLEDRLFAADLSPASLSADEGIMAAIMAERDMLKTRLKEQ